MHPSSSLLSINDDYSSRKYTHFKLQHFSIPIILFLNKLQLMDSSSSIFMDWYTENIIFFYGKQNEIWIRHRQYWLLMFFLILLIGHTTALLGSGWWSAVCKMLRSSWPTIWELHSIRNSGIISPIITSPVMLVLVDFPINR